MSDSQPDRRDLVAQASGTVILIGGATTPTGAALGEFVRLSKGRAGGKIVALTTASGNPIVSAKQWRRDLIAAGCTHLHTPIVANREQACDPQVVEAIQAADGVFLGGGDQVKLVSILGGSPIGEAIRDAYVRGIVIGGTSAGAAALAKTTLAGNEVDESGHLVEQYIGPGLGLVRHPAIIDTHFSQRRRLYRLFVALAEFPELLGLGIDENTALVLNDDTGRVVGTGSVTFVDGRGVTFSNAAQLREGKPLTLSAMRVGIVGAGYTLNLKTRELLVD
ncbi:MAG TPA: cyanophycinase [Gemmatimonadaceae bacterium]|jgi:cyanophycinase|nr:cyanophycinase [Gemmatimonadaceae bacterium]